MSTNIGIVVIMRLGMPDKSLPPNPLPQREGEPGASGDHVPQVEGSYYCQPSLLKCHKRDLSRR